MEGRTAGVGPRTDASPEVFIACVTETWPPEVNGVALTTARSVRWLRERNHFVDLIRPRQSGGASCCSIGNAC